MEEQTGGRQRQERMRRRREPREEEETRTLRDGRKREAGPEDETREGDRKRNVTRKARQRVIVCGGEML